MFGLSSGDFDLHYSDIDFALYPYLDGTLYVYEKGVSRGSFGSYAVGDQLRVSVDAGVVTYRKNGAVFYTSSVPPVFPLLIDTSLYSTGAAFPSSVLSGSLAPVSLPEISGVTWTSAVGVTVGPGSLSKPGAPGWDAGAISTKALVSGDGWAEFTVGETNTSRMFGLSNGNVDQQDGDIDFALYPYLNGDLKVYEKGSYKGSFGTYSAGDRLRVSVQGGVVTYSQNGTVFYTSYLPPIYPLLVDTALYSTDATIGDAILSGNLTENVTWTSAVGVTVTSASLSKPGAAAWDAGAVSTRALAFGEGWAEFTVSEANTSRMFGLSNGNTGEQYADIDFAFYPYFNGELRIYEQGVYIGTFGTYAVGDRLRVAVEGTSVRYRRNGALLYTSSAAPVYPLLIDTALYSTGATITNATLSGNFEENVVWTSAVGVTVSANSLSKPGGTSAWDAGAASTRSIAAGDGWAEFTASETNKARVFGLSNGNGGVDRADLDFAIYLRTDGLVSIYEFNVNVGPPTPPSYSVGDRFRVSVEGGVVKYRKNGTLIYTSAAAPTFPLLVDTSLWSPGATITSATLAGKLQ
jgi:hypothetical protein